LDTFFFLASKFIWVILSPANWLIFMPVLAIVLKRLGFLRWSSLIWSIEIFTVVLIGFYPVGQWLVKPLEYYRVDPPSADVNPDGIIVLGGAWITSTSDYWQQWELNHAAEREFALLTLARRYPEAKLVFTGGSGKVFVQGAKEATFAQTLYEDMGLDLSRVTFESESRNTYENALLSKQLVQPNEGEVWWLVTSAYHMPRAVGVFCKQAWAVQTYPVDHFYSGFSARPQLAFADHLLEFERVVHEWVGLVAYRVTGKTTSMFPDQC